MNGALTLSKDQLFTFRQGRCVGGSTTVNNSVAFKPEGFWWESNLVGRWEELGIHLDWESLHANYDDLKALLHVAPVDCRVISQGSRTLRSGFEAVGGDHKIIQVPSNTMDCVGCGRCNLGCPYDAKRGLLATLIPDFVRKGGLLVPDTDVDSIEFTGAPGKQSVASVTLVTPDGERVRIEAEKFVLAAGAYASSKLLWKSGFTGADPDVRTVGKRFSVNHGTGLVAVFPTPQDN